MYWMFTDPLILGVIAFGITYVYLKNENDKKFKDIPELKPPVDYKVPIAIGLGVAVLVFTMKKYGIIKDPPTINFSSEESPKVPDTFFELIE